MNIEHDPWLSVVIPAFNESKRLGSTLRTILKYLRGTKRVFEVIVVDDGSSDGTAGVAEAFSETEVMLVKHPSNLGKGAAVRTGILASRGEKILVTDADLSTPIEDLERLTPFTGEAPLVFGSRAVSGSWIIRRQPIYRETMGKIFNLIIRALSVTRIRDTQCGFKLLQGAIARDLFSRMVTNGFAFDVELAWLAQGYGYRIDEVGVRWANSPESTVNPLSDPPAMILEILRFRWHHRRLFRHAFFRQHKQERLIPQTKDPQDSQEESGARP